MIVTVGPITTAGISLSIHFVPTALTINEIITYTRPAKIAPMIKPKKPTDIDTPPANAASIDPMNANEDPRNTGLLNLVNNW